MLLLMLGEETYVRLQQNKKNGDKHQEIVPAGMQNGENVFRTTRMHDRWLWMFLGKLTQSGNDNV